MCRKLRDEGFTPDLVVGHSGWGETLFIKDVYPNVPLLANFEFYYHAEGVDVGFDPEFVSIFNEPARLRTRNATNLMAWAGADWGHTATQLAAQPVSARDALRGSACCTRGSIPTGSARTLRPHSPCPPVGSCRGATR